VPTRQGFDRFFGYLDQAHAHNHYPSFLMRGEERDLAAERPGLVARMERIMEEAHVPSPRFAVPE
jgi:hypothetical protein